MVTTLQRHELVPLGMPQGILVLHGHLRRDLDRNRTRVGEEDAVESGRRKGRELLRELNRRIVREPTEHHMTEPLGLPPNRLDDRRMIVAVRDAPPAGHRIHELPSIGQLDRDAGRRLRELHRRRIPERGIGMPDMRTIVVQGTHAKISEKSTSG